MDPSASAEIAGAARACQILEHAVRLAKWVGDWQRPLTPSGVLRRPDVPAAGAALGISIPAKLRTAADVSGLHRPWAFAIGAGLIRVADDWSEDDPEEPGPFDIDAVNRRLTGVED